MNKKLIALAVAVGIGAPMAAQAKPEVKWFGFAQITGQKLDQNTPNDGVTFGADRVRIGFKVKDGNVFGKLQVDFNKTGSNVLPQIIKDVEVGYKFSDAVKVKAGLFKTPLGMDFNTSGKKLDITKRGMEKKLVLERAAGVMLSGRKIGGGFGYDVFYGNPSTRSSAISSAAPTTGQDNTTVVRVMYDIGKTWHMEASSGTSTIDGGNDYEVTDFAVRYKAGRLVVKGEYISASNTGGTLGRDENVLMAHVGYTLNKSAELVARYYGAEADAYGATASGKLSNIYLGVNLFLGSTKTNGRLQLNYVVVGGDDINSATPYAGVSTGYTDDAILAQYQMSF